MIEAVIEDDAWLVCLEQAEDLAASCYKAAASVESKIVGEVALLFTDDEVMCDLNQRFRGKNKPTNVLSFPGGDGGEMLGDIALGREICVKEAADLGLSLREHAAHLIVHGLLHLAGYDHQTIAEAGEMEEREVEILRLLNIANPYLTNEEEDRERSA